MPTVRVFEDDYRLAAGDTLSIHNDQVLSLWRPLSGPATTGNVFIAGTVKVTADGSGFYSWSSIGVSPDNSSSLFKIESTGKFDVDTDFNGEAFVLKVESTGPDIVNEGVVTLKARDTGVAFEDWGNPRFDNLGSIRVEAGGATLGVRLVNAGLMVNKGLIEVHSTGKTLDLNTPVVRAVMMSGSFGDFSNSGTIIARSDVAGAQSTAVWWQVYQGFNTGQAPLRSATFFNGGRLEGEFALKASVGSGTPLYSDQPWTETFENTGVMAGKVSLGGSYAALVNSGRITGDIDLGAGDDAYRGGAGQADANVSGGAGADTLQGGMHADSLLGDDGDDRIDGGDGANFLRGGAGADLLQGGGQFDDMHGNQGADTLKGGSGDDWLVGGQDGDQLSGELGADIVYGNLGADTVIGGDGGDWVRGGQDNDSLDGGTGVDWLWGDRGDDTIAGGTGADIFHAAIGAGLDRILDFNPLEGDRIVLDGSPTYTSRQDGADLIIELGGSDRVVLVGVQLQAMPPGWIT